MKKQSGFTLIELVIVIIILGILAAVAVPRFIDLQGDARASATQGLRAAIEDGASLTFARSAIDGLDRAANTPIGNGQDVELVFGYPAATNDGIMEAIELSGGDWDNRPEQGGMMIFSTNVIDPLTCNVLYMAPTAAGERPDVQINLDDC